MSRLTVHDLADPDVVHLDTTDGDAIAAALGAMGVRFERWHRQAPAADADEAEVLRVYADDVARLKAEGGYRSVDVVRVGPDHPARDALRLKFLDEHTHAEDEVRFFVEGEGLFFLRLGDRVHRVHCAKDDLISVPAGTPHWFDTGLADGARPHFTAIRLFTNADGWVAQPTGTDHAARFPLLDPR